MQKPGRSITRDYDFERHVNLSVQLSRWLLAPMGVWPIFQDVTETRKCLHRLINAVCYGLISFLFVPCALYTVFEAEGVYMKLRLFGPMCFCVMAFAKYSSLIIHAKDIRECIERIEWDWKNIRHVKDRDIMVANAMFGRRLVTVCTVSMYSGFLFYYIAVPINVGKVPAEDKNLTFIPMVFPFSSFIIDSRRSPINEIIFSVQLLAGALIHGITAGACSLAAIFAVHAYGQMDVLIYWLKHLIDGRADMCDDVDVRIAKIVSQHVRILKFLSLIEKTLQQISFVEFVGCSINLCLLGYYTIMDWGQKELTLAITYVVLLISITFNIFIFCYIGELVAEQSKEVGKVTYMIDWHRLAGNRKLCCVLIIGMSNSSVKLTAGNMVILSLTTFSDVVKTSFAFLNMLRTLT